MKVDAIHKIILLGSTLLFFLACAVPQTRDEMRDGAIKRSMVQTYITQRNFDAVIKTLCTKSEECLNFSTTTTRMRSGPLQPTFTATHRTTVQVINSNKAELNFQVTPPGIKVQKMPSEGFYAFLVDIERHSENQTLLTIYGPSGYDKYYDAIKKWSDGKEADCPVK